MFLTQLFSETGARVPLINQAIDARHRQGQDDKDERGSPLKELTAEEEAVATIVALCVQVKSRTQSTVAIQSSKYVALHTDSLLCNVVRVQV